MSRKSKSPNKARKPFPTVTTIPKTLARFWNHFAQRYVLKMKKLVIIFFIILSTSSHASGPFIRWDGWKIDFHSTGCDLLNSYSLPKYSKDKGQLFGTPFTSISFRFSAPTKEHGSVIPKESVGIIRTYLLMTRHMTEPFSGGALTSVKINDKEVQDYYNHYPRIGYWLTEKQSLELFEEFKNGDKIEIEMAFSASENKIITIYPQLKNYNHTWAKIFQTCLKEHK